MSRHAQEIKWSPAGEIRRVQSTPLLRYESWKTHFEMHMVEMQGHCCNQTGCVSVHLEAMLNCALMLNAIDSRINQEYIDFAWISKSPAQQQKVVFAGVKVIVRMPFSSAFPVELVRRIPLVYQETVATVGQRSNAEPQLYTFGRRDHSAPVNAVLPVVSLVASRMAGLVLQMEFLRPEFTDDRSADLQNLVESLSTRGTGAAPFHRMAGALLTDVCVRDLSPALKKRLRETHDACMDPAAFETPDADEGGTDSDAESTDSEDYIPDHFKDVVDTSEHRRRRRRYVQRQSAPPPSCRSLTLGPFHQISPDTAEVLRCYKELVQAPLSIVAVNAAPTAALSKTKLRKLRRKRADDVPYISLIIKLQHGADAGPGEFTSRQKEGALPVEKRGDVHAESPRYTPY